MAVPPELRQAYGLYGGVIAEAVRRGTTTAQLWDAIRASAAEMGATAPGVGIVAVSKLRGIASQAQAAADRLMALNPDDGIRSDVISRPASSSTYTTGGTPNGYQVRYLATVVNPTGETQQVWQSVEAPDMPQTHQDVLDLIDSAIENDLPNSPPGTEFVSLDSYQLIGL